jgi:hypothetical protein
MRAIYALYSNPHSAQRAVDDLRAAGWPDARIAVMSSEPLEEYEFGRRDRATVMPWISGLGGAVGLALGYYLTSITQEMWPINTGGMPIVPIWTNLVVMFEFTMLAAILAAVVTLLVTAKLPSRLPACYDLEISDGKILVAVENPPAAVVAQVEQMLANSGPGQVKRLE